MLVREIFEPRSVNGIRSAARLHVDGRPAGEPLLRVKAVGDDVDFLNRLEGRDVGDDVRQLNVRGADAVNPRVVLIVARAVDREFQRSRRVARDRMRIGRRGETRQHAVDLLVVAAERNGQVRQLRTEQV